MFAESGISESDHIIVTGSHTPITINEIGSSYTVITETQIKQRQAVQIADLLRDVPGFSISNGGSIGSQIQLRIRGAEANQLLVLIDGIEANDIASGDEFDFAHLMTTNIERIEIIRGPQSALYGSDALSGVINIITKKGSGPITLSTFLETGSFGTFNAGGGISGSGDGYHYNLQGSYLNSAGSNIAPAGDEDDAYENATISFAAGTVAFDNLKIDITGRHTKANNETDDQDFLVTGFAIDADRETKTNQDYLRSKISLSLFNDAWEHIAGVAITSTENNHFISGNESNSTQGKKFRFDYKTNFYLDTENPSSASHILTLGIDYERDLFTQRGTAFLSFDPNQKQNITTTGLVLGYRVGLWERLFVSGNIRYDDNSDFDDTTIYQITGAYKLLDWGTRLHGSYATGIKRPTFSDRFGFYANTFIGNPDLNPEKSKSWDVGITQVLWNDKANADITYFNSRLDDEINGFFFNGAGFTAININGTSKRQGVEITVDAKLSDNLEFTGTHTWLDATEANAVGNQILEMRRPKTTSHLNLNYNFFGNRGNVNLNISHTGTRRDTNFATQAAVDLSSYVLVNLAASYHITKNVNINARVQNLLDENYVDVLGFQTAGVSGIVGLKINF